MKEGRKVDDGKKAMKEGRKVDEGSKVVKEGSYAVPPSRPTTNTLPSSPTTFDIANCSPTEICPPSLPQMQSPILLPNFAPHYFHVAWFRDCFIPFIPH